MECRDECEVEDKHVGELVWGWREDAKSWEHISQVDDSVDRMLGMFLTGGLGVEKMSETKQKRVGD